MSHGSRQNHALGGTAETPHGCYLPAGTLGVLALSLTAAREEI